MAGSSSTLTLAKRARGSSAGRRSAPSPGRGRTRGPEIHDDRHVVALDVSATRSPRRGVSISTLSSYPVHTEQFPARLPSELTAALQGEIQPSKRARSRSAWSALSKKLLPAFWPVAARQLLAQQDARPLARNALSLRLDIAPAFGGFVENPVRRLDAAGFLQFVQKVAGRNRRHALGQNAHEFSAANIAVLEQKKGIEFRMGRDLIAQHFKRGLLAPSPGTGVWIDGQQGFEFRVDLRRDNLDLSKMRANPLDDFLGSKLRHVPRHLGIDHIGNEHRHVGHDETRQRSGGPQSDE